MRTLTVRELRAMLANYPHSAPVIVFDEAMTVHSVSEVCCGSIPENMQPKLDDPGRFCVTISTQKVGEL